MTHAETNTLKEFKSVAIKWLAGLGGAAIVGLTTFYFTTTAEIEYQRQEISELKSAVKAASPEEISRIKSDLNDMQKKMEEISIQVTASTKIMESFKDDQERKVDKIMDILLEIKRSGN